MSQTGAPPRPQRRGVVGTPGDPRKAGAAFDQGDQNARSACRPHRVRLPVAQAGAQGDIRWAFMDRATIGKAPGRTVFLPAPAFRKAQEMPHRALQGIAIDCRMADLPIFQQGRATSDLLGPVLLVQPRDQFALHGAHVDRATTITPKLATDRTGMAADQGCALSLREARSMQGCTLMALFQAQVPTVRVQLHFSVKRRRLRHLSRFSSGLCTSRFH